MLEPQVVPWIIFDEWGTYLFVFGAKMAKTRGRNKRKHAFRSAALEVGR